MSDTPRTAAVLEALMERVRPLGAQLAYNLAVEELARHAIALEGELSEKVSALSDARNAALERAAQECESMLTRHGERKGGSNTGDAARSMCATRIRMLKTPEAPK